MIVPTFPYQFAKELGIKPVEDLISKMGISDEEHNKVFDQKCYKNRKNHRHINHHTDNDRKKRYLVCNGIKDFSERSYLIEFSGSHSVKAIGKSRQTYTYCRIYILFRKEKIYERDYKHKSYISYNIRYSNQIGCFKAPHIFFNFRIGFKCLYKRFSGSELCRSGGVSFGGKSHSAGYHRNVPLGYRCSYINNYLYNYKNSC